MTIAAMESVPFSWTVFLTLLVVLAAAVGVFWMLVRRWTIQRHWSAMAEWARGNQFSLHSAKTARPPEPLLSQLAHLQPRARYALADEQQTLVQVQTSATPASRTPQQPATWNVLVRRVESDWPATGLRPSAHRTSLIDLFTLSSFPSLIPPERFVLFGSDPPAARLLAAAPVRSLLPPDVGLLLYRQYLVLDFSTRPFDPVEFGRMIALADQVLAHLPALAPSGDG